MRQRREEQPSSSTLSRPTVSMVGFMQESTSVPMDVEMNEVFRFGQRREKNSTTVPSGGGVVVWGDVGRPSSHGNGQGCDEGRVTLNPISDSAQPKM